MDKKYYINKDQAIKLKELGYDNPCYGYYQKSAVIGDNTILPLILPGDDNEDSWSPTNWNDEVFSKHGVPFYSAPTYQEVFDWFHKTYKLIQYSDLMGMSSYVVMFHLDTEEYRDKIVDLKYACLDQIVDIYDYDQINTLTLDRMFELVESENLKKWQI